ncbi:MAG: tyrosine-type recombinase/integrase, partial [bacterium]
LSPAVAEALLTHPMRSERDLVFCQPGGGPLDPDNLVKRVFKKTVEDAKLPAHAFHALRHTYATLQIAAGASPKYLQEQMGHWSVKVTLDYYGHLWPSAFRGQADRLEALVFGQATAVGQTAVK